jgi:hypothetical protein
MCNAAAICQTALANIAAHSCQSTSFAPPGFVLLSAGDDDVPERVIAARLPGKQIMSVQVRRGVNGGASDRPSCLLKAAGAYHWAIPRQAATAGWPLSAFMPASAGLWRAIFLAPIYGWLPGTAHTSHCLLLVAGRLHARMQTADLAYFAGLRVLDVSDNQVWCGEANVWSRESQRGQQLRGILALPCLALPCLALPGLALPCLALPCLVCLGLA